MRTILASLATKDYVYSITNKVQIAPQRYSWNHPLREILKLNRGIVRFVLDYASPTIFMLKYLNKKLESLPEAMSWPHQTHLNSCRFCSSSTLQKF